MEFHTPQQVNDHLFEKGFLAKYRVWTWHGETDPVSTSTKCQDHQHNQRFRCHDYNGIIDMVEDAYDHCDKDPSSFKDMLEDAEKPLYPGAKHSKLSGLMRLYNVKGNYGWSDKGFSALLEVLADILPNNNNLPKSMYETKKTMNPLGLEFYPTEQEPLEIYLINTITQNPHLYQGGHDISVINWNFYGRDDPNDSWKLYGGDQLLEGQAIHFLTKLKKASPKGSRF
ncbi:hypothetical protein WN943_027454 [Citrus x changshan-huyou]